MRRAGRLVAETLALVGEAAAPGVTTLELDRLAYRHIKDAGAQPSFLGYYDFPGTLCVSVNDEIVHGIPGERELSLGDVVSVDCGAIVEGWHADSAITVICGGPETASADVNELLRVTEQAMWAGIEAARVGDRISDISHAVESSVRAAGEYGILDDYTGHGIGTEMHMEPDVPNVGRPGRGPRLEAGMALAIEPMVVLGSPANRTLADDWTVVTLDGSVGAHFEHTIAITDAGPQVLTTP